MSALHPVPAEYLLAIAVRKQSPAFLCLDEKGCLTDSGGCLETYGLDGFTIGECILEQLYFLHGLIPLQEAPAFLPAVKTDAGFCADIHIFRARERDWVLFLDSAAAENQKTQLQQVSNELSLLRERVHQGKMLADDDPGTASLLASLCKSLDMAVLLRLPDGSFQTVGMVPEWFHRFRLEQDSKKQPFHPELQSHFLKNFLIDAEEFWLTARPGLLKSGPWCESSESEVDTYLEATALNSEGSQLLLIEHPRLAYAEKQRLIQIGREQGLDAVIHERQDRKLILACHELEESVNLNQEQLVQVTEQLRHEVNHHQKTEKALRESEAHFQRLVEFSPLGILIADAYGIIHLANPAAVRALGAPDELYLLGMSLYDFCSGDHAQIISECFSEVLSGQESTVHTLTWFRRLDSQEFPADIDTGRFQWGGQPALQLMIHECSDRVRSEEALRSKEEQVRQLQKMEAIGRLAGGVAHDFNNLLTAITGYGEMIHSLLDPTDPIRSDIEQILSASEKAASLTRQLLTFSRKQVLQLQVLNLNTVLLNTEKLLRRLIGEDIELVVKTDPSLGNTQADPGQIEQVVLNLAINARDAMPGGGKLTIETSNVDLDEEYLQTHVSLDPGPYVTLVVTDTGCGMTKEVQSKVFEPFYTTKSEGKGTGLGLSMVYGIVTQIGGSIWLYSEPGHGTSFKIYLPRVNIEPAEAPSKRQGMNQGWETILVVEDEEAVRMLVSAVLSRNGYNVLEAASPSEAAMISELYNGTIHLLLTDTVMPETSGPELARQQLEKRPEMKVMLMSGYAGSAIDHLHLPDSQTPFLEKPFTPETLTRKVRNLLDEN